MRKPYREGMSDDTPNPEMEKRWQDYLKRRRRGKYLIIAGIVVIIVSLVLGVFPVAVSAFTGTVYVSTPMSNYFGVGVFFGIFLILAGIVSRIAPNMMEGDALWIWKMGPFGNRS
jgi:predicted ABC-type exoprotein transport system permease subunit